MNLRIKLMPTKRTDVMCTSCGRFRADLVVVRRDGTETDSGVHKKCAQDVSLKFTRKRRLQPKPVAGNDPWLDEEEEPIAAPPTGGR